MPARRVSKLLCREFIYVNVRESEIGREGDLMAMEIKQRWQKDKSLISSWLDMSAQYGDVYRQCLINPVIHGLLASSAWRMASSPINYVLAEWLDTYCGEDTETLSGA